MIRDDKEYAASQKQLIMLEKALASDVKKGTPDMVKEAGKAQLKELIDNIQTEISEYKNSDI